MNTDELTELWFGHCAFHAGEYRKAISIYERMLIRKNCPPEVNVYIACCFFFLGLCAEAKQYAEKGPKSALQNRLLLHLAYRLKDEKQLLVNRNNLQSTAEDQLSLAAMHYLNSHYQEAIDIYKKILANKKNFIALNVYLALCYYKLDYYDVSLEMLQLYLNENPDSAIAINLRACNHYKLYNGKTATKELQKLKNVKVSTFTYVKDLISHNTVVFYDGNAALQVFPPLMDTLPEARLNLIIFYLKRDTITGRQAMASSYFLNNQFDEVLVYLDSIKTYFHDDDTFNFNIGQALLACGNSLKAETSLLLVVDEELRLKPAYFLSLARAYIQNGKSDLAWEMYGKVKNCDDSFQLLSIIANDCYRVYLFDCFFFQKKRKKDLNKIYSHITIGDYLYSAKSFDSMEITEPNPEYWEGKRGAIIGVFKLVVEQKAPLDHLREAMILLERSTHPQVEYIANIIRKYIRRSNLNCDF
ncbi:cytosolic purine 5-nucleotidase, putative [Brugia malayi]|uniref:Intraflagellar transport protein 56 n=1 Tax=Brugia malayi TaxID=6279 RepID=A0A0J9XNE3_BRUMA|nr:cytosolic purine 5-nucleotidase, putative [Brugia malayi]CDP91696.2 BMA-DYF-13 [Brugia malayi]VIO93458.1 cytosolic purine 5-nucleotidase, putative [Brugia malayi]